MQKKKLKNLKIRKTKNRKSGKTGNREISEKKPGQFHEDLVLQKMMQ